MEGRAEEGTYRVLPARAQPCVWMVAGVLSYRLCDRDYDCDHCPLDSAIHGTRIAAPQDPGETEGPPAERIRDGLRYHPVYGWVAEAGESRLRWGIDGVTAMLLDRVTAVVLPAAGTDIAQGQAACWVMDDRELVPLRSPISGTVARTNPAVQGDADLVSHDPYDSGWLIEVDGGGLASQPGLCGAEERRQRAVRQLRRLRHAVASYLHVPKCVGQTAPDGGEQLGEFRRVLGNARYHRLVFSLLR